jgi:ferredoxin-NADP reductase
VSGDPVALDPRKRLTLTLASREELSHNVVRLRFALPSAGHRFGLPVGKHVFLYASVAGETVMRAYTPTTADEVRGHFDLVVKVYKSGEHPRFPDGGKMSQWLAALVPGKDTVDVKGPVGHFEYLKNGRFVLNRQPCALPARSISLIAGGTGITPCWAVLRAVLSEKEEEEDEGMDEGEDGGGGANNGGGDGGDGGKSRAPVKVALLYANQTEDDILMREELEALAEEHPDRFRLSFTLDRPPEGDGWKGFRGFIDEDKCRAALLPPGDGAIVAMCGPPPMIKFACVPSLEKMGYAAESMISF